MENGYDPLDYRYFCLGAHYRSQLAYGLEGLDAARAARQGVIERVVQLKKDAGAAASAQAAPEGKAREYLDRFEEHAADDLNMPKCLADLWTLLRDTAVPVAAKLSAALQMDRILDIGIRGAKEIGVALDEEARVLIAERDEARRNKDWKRADEIRDMLAARGIKLEDQAKGTKIRASAGKTAGEKPVTSHGESC
jgi:cysteinyl-tRNA synthetase